MIVCFISSLVCNVLARGMIENFIPEPCKIVHKRYRYRWSSLVTVIAYVIIPILATPRFGSVFNKTRVMFAHLLLRPTHFLR